VTQPPAPDLVTAAIVALPPPGRPTRSTCNASTLAPRAPRSISSRRAFADCGSTSARWRQNFCAEAHRNSLKTRRPSRRKAPPSWRESGSKLGPIGIMSDLGTWSICSQVSEPPSSGGLLSTQNSDEIRTARPDPPNSIGLDAHGKVDLPGAQAQWTFRSTGLYAGAATAGAALAGELIWLQPTANTQHFLLMAITIFVCGAFVSAALLSGRLADALSEKENYRTEMNRIAREKRELESLILHARLSSDSPPPETAQTSPPKGRNKR